MAERSPLVRQWLVLRAIAAANGGATIRTLVAQTQVSEKTIRRDVAALRRAGFPLVEQAGEFGRKTYALDAAHLPPAELRYDEALALFYCRRAVMPLAGTFFFSAAESAFRKLKSSLGPKAAAYVDRMLARVHQTHPAGTRANKAEIVDQLLLAVEECRATFITYHSSHSSESLTYPIEPYGVIEHRGSLYVVGHSQQHYELRHWKVDRIEAVKLTRFPFQRPTDFDLERHLAGSLGVYHGDESVRVRVRFAPAAARYLREKRMHASQRLKEQRGGGAIVEWTLSSTIEAKSFILSFGAAAEVIEPASLRDAVAAEIASLARTYASAAGRGRLKKNA